MTLESENSIQNNNSKEKNNNNNSMEPLIEDEVMDFHLNLHYERPTCFKPPKPCDIIMNYIIRTPSIPPKFDVPTAMKLGVPKGPLFGKLSTGSSIELPDGRVIHPHECMFGGVTLGPVCIIITCPSEEYTHNLFKNEKWLEFYDNSIVSCIVHITPQVIIENEEYATWMLKFSISTKHIFVNDTVDNKMPTLTKSDFLVRTLNSFDPLTFEIPKIPKPYEPSPFLSSLKMNKNFNFCAANFLMKFILQPTKSAGIDNKMTITSLSPVTSFAGYTNARDIFDEQLYQNFSEELPIPNISRGEVVFHFFGTGAASPSHSRNGSMLTVIHRNSACSIIIDAGSGTYSQMCRKFGEDINHVLSTIKCIWVSHKHPDHHTGVVLILQQIFQARKLLELPPFEPVVIGPYIFEGYLHEVSLMSYLEPLRYQFHLNQTIKDRNHFLSNFFFEEYGFTNIQTIEVLHGGFACALILEHEKGWKIVYSGDTRPSKSLVEIGKDCTLLIHEATMINEDIIQAFQKAHSTTGEVLHVAKLMNAYRTAFTHFSQRQNLFPVHDLLDPSIPFGNLAISQSVDVKMKISGKGDEILFSQDEYDPVPVEKIIIAFDLASFDLVDLPRLPMLNKPLGALYKFNPHHHH